MEEIILALSVWWFVGMSVMPALPAALAQGYDEDEERLVPIKTDVSQLADTLAARATGGRPVKEVKYVAGKDGVWFSADDEVYHYFTAAYDAGGNMLTKICYTVGSDKTGFTTDDPVQNYMSYEYDADGRLNRETYYTASGADNTWLTADDAQGYYVLPEYDIQGNRISMIRYNPQREIIRVITYTYGPAGKIMDVEYKSAGKDGQWFSGDDEIEKYHRFEYDRQGRMIRAREYHAEQKGPGADGRWFTPDDVVSSTKVFLYKRDNRVSQTKKYIGSGADRRWFTKDDVLQYYTKREYSPIQ
jgi:hypothetical protein